MCLSLPGFCLRSSRWVWICSAEHRPIVLHDSCVYGARITCSGALQGRCPLIWAQRPGGDPSATICTKAKLSDILRVPGKASDHHSITNHHGEASDSAEDRVTEVWAELSLGGGNPHAGLRKSFSSSPCFPMRIQWFIKCARPRFFFFPVAPEKDIWISWAHKYSTLSFMNIFPHLGSLKTIFPFSVPSYREPAWILALKKLYRSTWFLESSEVFFEDSSCTTSLFKAAMG